MMLVKSMMKLWETENQASTRQNTIIIPCKMLHIIKLTLVFIPTMCEPAIRQTFQEWMRCCKWIFDGHMQSTWNPIMNTHTSLDCVNASQSNVSLLLNDQFITTQITGGVVKDCHCCNEVARFIEWLSS